MGSAPKSGGGTRPAWRPRWRRLLAALGASLFAFALLLELALRAAVFTESEGLARIAWRLREPDNFSSRWYDDYWILKHRFTRPDDRLPALYDPLLGWRASWISPGDYRHADADRIGERRPVLLYGDSFAACVTPPEDCWQGLLERSELGGRYALLNYGVGGYGLDQAYLLLRETLDLWAARDPVVVVAVLVDDDLDRSLLRFRGWPKPRLVLTESGALEPDEPRVPSVDEYLVTHPIGIRSYALRYLLYGARLLPRNETESWIGRGTRVERAQELNRAILEAIRAETAARDLELFVLLLHGSHYLRQHDWREVFLVTELERLGVPYVSSKPLLLADRERSGRPEADYFIAQGRGVGHYTPLANEVVFAALAAGLRGDFDG